MIDQLSNQFEILRLGADDERIIAIVDGDLRVLEDAGGGDWRPSSSSSSMAILPIGSMFA